MRTPTDALNAVVGLCAFIYFFLVGQPRGLQRGFVFLTFKRRDSWQRFIGC